jgi:hypothetical protein
LTSPWTEPGASHPITRFWQETREQAVRAQTEWQWGGFFRWFGIAFAGGLLILLIALITLDWNTMRGPVSRLASARLGRPVAIDGNLRVHLFSFTPWMTAEHVRVGNPNWLAQSEMAHVDKLIIKVRLIPLIFGHARFPFVEADGPNAALFRDRQGRANWIFSADPTASGDTFRLPPIERFVVNNGNVTLKDDKNHMTFAGTFSSHEEIGGQRKDIFVLDGKGTLRGAPLSASVRGGPLIRVDPDKPYALNIDVRHGATHVVANGALARPFDLGQFTATAKLSGPTLADLYFLSGLAMPNTSPYRLSATLVRDGKLYRLEKLGGTVGKSDLFGEMSVDTSSGRPFLRATLKSKSLAFSDLGPMIGSTPGKGNIVREKTAGGRTETVTSTMRVLPDMPLRVERVRAMDAVVDYKAEAIRSQDFPLRQLVLHLTLDHGVMRLNPLTFTFPNGKLAGKVKVDARGAVPINDVDARITDVQLAQFFGGAHPLIEGTMEARAVLHAPGDSIHKAAAAANGTFTVVVPKGAVRKSYAELSGIDVTPGLFELLGNDKSDTNLRCAVAHFETHNGTMQSEQLVADTDAVRIDGRGTVNLDNEQVNFTMQGEPKSFKLIRVRAPITVTGSLGSPHVGVKAGPAVAQTGIAVLLGVFLTPAAAILPFVDPGLGKDANCTALLTTAKAQGAPVKTKAIRTAAPAHK